MTHYEEYICPRCLLAIINHHNPYRCQQIIERWKAPRNSSRHNRNNLYRNAARVHAGWIFI